MVLESLLNPTIAKKKPWDVFAFGMFAASIGLFLSYWIFREYSSLIMVFLITLSAVPLFYFTVTSEEQYDLSLVGEPAILKEHSRVLFFLMTLFVGITVALSIWYIILPASMTNVLFASQSQTIVDINNHISGNFFSVDILAKIFLNNFRVLVFSILFAFLYGVGSLFILTWNAAVIAVAIGNFVRINLAAAADVVGFHSVGVYLGVFSLGLLRYFIHGIPEILAYFVGGLAGGIISVAIIKHDLFSDRREKILFDAAELVLIAVGLLVIAAVLEVTVTPLLF